MIFSDTSSKRRITILKSPVYSSQEDNQTAFSRVNANAFRLKTGDGPRPNHPSYKLRTPHLKMSENERKFLQSRGKTNINAADWFKIEGRGSQSVEFLSVLDGQAKENKIKEGKLAALHSRGLPFSPPMSDR